MGKYKKCPRCELNWIPEDEEYCEICKQELEGKILDDDYDEDICPVCGINPLEPGDKMCAECRAKAERLGKDDEYESEPQPESDNSEYEDSYEAMREDELYDDFDEEIGRAHV